MLDEHDIKRIREDCEFHFNHDSLAFGKAVAEAAVADERSRAAAPMVPEEWRTQIEKAISRAKVFDDGSDGADAESAQSVVAILRALLAAPAPVVVAWMKPDGSDAWTDAKKQDAIRHGGTVGAFIAADYSVALTMAAPAPKCETCNGHGMIGGPSYYQPDEGGVPCPDCNPAPERLEKVELTDAEYRRGFTDGYNQRDAEVRGALV